MNKTFGLPALIGNRENFPTVEGWIGRAKRAHMNMLENIAPFAALVLIALAGVTLFALTSLLARRVLRGWHESELQR